MGSTDGIALQGATLSEDQHALHQLGELVEAWKDRLSFKDLRLSERYVNGALNLLIEASWASMDFHAIVGRVDATSICWHTSGLWEPLPDDKLTVLEAEWEQRCRVDVEGCRCCWDDAVVFVENVEPVEAVQGGIPSTVLLQPKDALASLGTDSVYFGYGTGFRVFGLVEGQPAVRSWSCAVSSNQIAHKEIKNATEVVDCVADNARNLRWDRFPLREAINSLSRLRIVLTDKFIRLGFVELPDDRLKIKNVMFGPF